MDGLCPHRELGPFDLGLPGRFLGLQVVVVQREQDRALLDLVPDVEGKLGDQASNFRAHRDRVDRADLARRRDRKIDVAVVRHRGGGLAGRFGICRRAEADGFEDLRAL